MLIKEIPITLRDGRRALLTVPAPQDAAQLLDQMRAASAETEFMSRYPDEIPDDVQRERTFILEQASDPHCLLLCAYVDGQLIASGSLTPVSRCERYRHRADFGVSILKAFWGQGIGSALLRAAFQNARGMGYEQIELSVIEGNTRARALYERFGFQAYGVCKNYFKYRDGRYAHAVMMSAAVPH